MGENVPGVGFLPLSGLRKTRLGPEKLRHVAEALKIFNKSTNIYVQGHTTSVIYGLLYYFLYHYSLDLSEIRLGQEPFLWAELLSWHEMREANHSSSAGAAIALRAIAGASRLSVRPSAKRLDASVVLSREKIGEHWRTVPGDRHEVLWESETRERKRSIDRWRVASRDEFITARQHTNTLMKSTA